MTLGEWIEARADADGNLPDLQWRAIAALMDDDAREATHSAVAPW
jgi:hypothetical protein